ncbi:hypothetical protein AB205_0119940 [Aquarana catesbeiana]|uniref:ACB domain-containing protein n=1 Tax=Aquarana catesbeiana TaxID=8400 RepID=A0A2G9R691_AQUCT|nr:hypothetical protein AB205_0119940 [Aquarana catesbeiana]
MCKGEKKPARFVTQDWMTEVGRASPLSISSGDNSLANLCMFLMLGSPCTPFLISFYVVQHFDLRFTFTPSTIMADTKPLHQKRFEAAVSVIQSLPKNEYLSHAYCWKDKNIYIPCDSNKSDKKIKSIAQRHVSVTRKWRLSHTGVPPKSGSSADHRPPQHRPSEVLPPSSDDGPERKRSALNAVGERLCSQNASLPVSLTTDGGGSTREPIRKSAGVLTSWAPWTGSFQPSNEMMLKFYSFYKQATQGPCNIPRPAFWDPVGRYKWDAWNSLGDMTKEDAMVAYVDEMKKILESMPMTEKVEELLQVIGPFYEIVEDKKHGRGSGVTSELSTALTSTPNGKAVNGKAESSDSGAESEEEDAGRREEEEEEEEEDDEGETEQSEQGEEKAVQQDSAPEPCPGGTVANGLLINHSYYVPDIPNLSTTKSDLNKIEEETGKEPNTEDDGYNDVDEKKGKGQS